MRSASANTASMSCSTSTIANLPFSLAKRLTMPADSAGPMPAIGSASSRRRGPVASAIAISSARFSPCGRTPAGSPARCSSPTSASDANAGSRSNGSRRAGFQKRKLCPDRACTASATFSSTVNSRKIEVIWNERAIPSPARRGGPSRDTSVPAKRIVPASGRSSPESSAIRVVLPAPFGPMIAWSSPGATASDTSLVAVRPPKRLISPRVSSSASAIAPAPLRKQAEQAAFRKQHDEDQDRPERGLPMLGQARQHALQDQIGGRAENWTDQRADAPQDDHHHDLARTGPMHDRGRHEQGQVCEQRTSEAANRAGDYKGGELVAEGREADRQHTALVRFDALQKHAKPRLHEAAAKQQNEYEKGEGEIVEDRLVGEIDQPGEVAVPRDVEPVIAAIAVHADSQEIHHLAEGQGDHDEIDAGGAQRHEADRERRSRGREQGRGEMDEAVADPVKAQDADGIGADAEIGGVAEADEPGIAEGQIEAHRGDREDHHAGEKAGIERRVENRGERRHHGQSGEAERHCRGSAAEPHQRPRGGNRPCGRTNSTTAIRI